MQTINVYSVRTATLKKVETNAKTWGELKSVLLEMGLFSNNMKAIHKETQVTLESDEIKIKDGFGTLIIVPVDSKAGSNANNVKEVAKELKEELLKVVERELDKVVENYINNNEVVKLEKEIADILKNFRK